MLIRCLHHGVQHSDLLGPNLESRAPSLERACLVELYGLLGTKFSVMWIKLKKLFNNAYGRIFGKMLATLFMLQRVELSVLTLFRGRCFPYDRRLVFGGNWNHEHYLAVALHLHDVQPGGAGKVQEGDTRGRGWMTNVSSSPSGQNGRQFTNDIFKLIFINEKFCILMWISLKFVPIEVNTGSGNGLVPDRHQAITWTNADLV